MAITLSQAVEEFLVARRSNGYRKSTVRTDAVNMRDLIAIVGDIQVRNVTPRHVDAYLAAGTAKGYAPSTMNLRLASVRAFFLHCVQRRYVAEHSNPAAHRRRYVEPPKSRLRIPAFNFGRLLDAADNPRDRIVIALGLYLLLRESEIRLLRIADVDLHSGSVAVTIPKTSKSDAMPICAELDVELRTWLTYYSLHTPRTLRPTDFLVPPWELSQVGRTEDGKYRVIAPTNLVPDRDYTTPHRAVQKALLACGYLTHDADGKSLREGVHTLRRSAARARYDSLVERGHDKALRHVQTLLHHSSSSTTEHYIGIDPDVKDRDDMLRGEVMFPAAASEAALRRIG